MMLITLISTVLLSTVRSSHLAVNGKCQEGYAACHPRGTATNSEDIIHLYQNLVGSVDETPTKKDITIGGSLVKKASDPTLCCVQSMQCLLLINDQVPFCWDRFTTNVYFADGWYGSITNGNFTSPSGRQVNLITGKYADGSGNLYAADSEARPNTATMDLPTPWTSKGVGSAIPASILGAPATYTMTIPGTTRTESIIPAETVADSTINGVSVPGTTRSASTIDGTTVAARVTTVTKAPAATNTHSGTVRINPLSSKLTSRVLELQADVNFSLRMLTMFSSVRSWIFCMVLLTSSSFTSAFYLPGVAPTSYDEGQSVPLYVNHLTPGLARQDDQIHSVFSYDYYHPALHFCRPEDGPKDVRESLGSILFGDRIRTSPFELHMAKNETCKTVCDEVKFDGRDADFTNRRILQGYNINWLVDGLPAAQANIDTLTNTEFYTPGFDLGLVDEKGQPFLNNHFDIVVEYHRVGLPKQNKYRVVGVFVHPDTRSGSKKLPDGSVDCGEGSAPLVLREDGETPVTWTYGVYWRESPTAWATRWDKYLHVIDPQIHWLSLINSAVFVILLVGMVSMILIRTLRKDIARYNRLDAINLEDLDGTSAAVEDGIQEDSGWKLVHGDVFRPPKYSLLLSVLVGNGAQIFVMAGVTVAIALLGLLSPSNRGFLGTAILILYTFFGFIGGYVSARTYKSLGGEAWKRNIILTPLLIPGFIFTVFFLLNLFVWAQGSSGAVPFSTMLVLVVIWFVISVPLSVAGSWVGFKQRTIEGPTKTNQIPRQVPPMTGTLRTIPSILLTGILPFAAIFLELYFIMNSIWTSKIYYMFGFLFLCYGLMIITCAATTVLLVYFLLCAENYRWHWRAFAGAGMTGGYVFVNALLFWATRVSFGGLTGAVLYVGYSALIGFLVFILTGAIGFFASWAFVQRIYGSIKVD
ncbi:endosomal integral membrane protein [Paecilomyces variotii No. 5]|uniref:Transmembrane 9 superfamily member n=1 Tax=Byssochlamys spectabilis (strain No. 5 / NBRC 109023) TaxID=1356009 RepID=V5FTB6_BYSSN|nr:endosomal integral membrane protein [Paecilomyces variotii No. 5]